MAQIVTTQPGTTVVVQQTQVFRDWNSGVFACFDDFGSCKLVLIVFFFFSKSAALFRELRADTRSGKQSCSSSTSVKFTDIHGWQC